MRCLIATALLFGLAAPCAAAPATRVRIAYFLEWPTPNLVAKADGAYEVALGLPVEWSAFDTGTQMTEALRAGAVDIAYSQGLAPFVAAVNADAPLLMVGAAVEYPSNDCVIREGSGLSADDPSSFAGASVALPLATMADYSFRLMTRALDIDAGAMRIVDRIPSEAAIALVEGEVDMACGFGALAMDKMRAAGTLLMDDAAKSAAEITSFDIVAVETDFARDNPELVRRFVEVTAEANATYTGSPEQLDKIGLEAGLDRSGVLRQLADFSFPSVDEQRGRLLGADGIAPGAMRVVGEAFATSEAPARTDYSDAIDLSFLP